MPISPGTPFGPYEILSPLGAGGIGEVYRARDLKLQRDVTLKVLPDAVARDADRRAPLTEIGPDGFDVAKDGRFLLLEQVASSTERLVHVVVNWTPRRAPGT